MVAARPCRAQLGVIRKGLGAAARPAGSTTQPPTITNDDHRAWLAELLVAGLVAAVYARSLTFGFVFDDLALIGSEGPRHLGNAWVPYRPLRHASYWLDHWVGGGLPWAYHATNVALHGLCAVLVVRLARRAGALPVLAALAGLLFALHPVCVEAVAYVAGRRDVLASLCGFGALYSWTSGRGRSAEALLLLLLAVAAKESALLFVPVLLVASLYGLGPSGRSAYAALALAAVAALALPVAYGATGPLAPHGSLVAKLAVTGRLAAHYVGSIAYPVGLSAEYPQLRCAAADCAALRGPLAAWGLGVLVGSVTLAAAAGIPALHGRSVTHARRWLALATGWAALQLVAVVWVVGMHEPGADRHVYPVMAALAVAAAACFAALPAGGRRLAGTIAAIVVVILAASTTLRLPVWRDGRSLWAATVRSSPTSARAHHNLAGTLVAEGRYRHARVHLQRALAANPEYAPSLIGLAAVACAAGHDARAKRHFAAARARGADPTSITAAERECAERASRPASPEG